MSESPKFTFGKEKLPATFTYDGEAKRIIIDVKDSTLITDEATALKRLKEYAVLKEVKAPMPDNGPAPPVAAV